jgi:hypothetical protein
MSKINIYVNSKNRKSDESPSNFSGITPDDLLYCYNNFIIVMKTAMDSILLLKII